MNETYRGGNKLILGIVLGVITFWLFAQSLVNVVPNLQQSFGADMGTISIAVSLTALFSGMFVVGAGGLADKIGRVKMTNIGLLLSIIGSALIIITNLPALLILGRIIQGVSAACIMPSTLAIMKTYYEGAERQRALSYWSIGSWGGSGICSLFGGQLRQLWVGDGFSSSQLSLPYFQCYSSKERLKRNQKLPIHINLTLQV